MSIELLSDTENSEYQELFNFSEPILIVVNLPKPDFLFANFSPIEKVKLIDGEGHLIIVRVVLKNTS